jgi:hypothetical protein
LYIYLLEVDVESTYTNLDKLPFIDEQLVVITTTSMKYFCAESCFKATTFLNSTGQILVINGKLAARPLGVPSEEGYFIRIVVRALKPSGTLTITSLIFGIIYVWSVKCYSYFNALVGKYWI